MLTGSKVIAQTDTHTHTDRQTHTDRHTHTDVMKTSPLPHTWEVITLTYFMILTFQRPISIK